MVLDSHGICIIGGNNTVNLDSSDEEDTNTDKSSHDIERIETESSQNSDKTPAIENIEATSSKKETVGKYPAQYCPTRSHLGLVARKPVFGVSDKASFKPNSTATETDQSAWMCRLVCAFVVCKPRKTGFLASKPISFRES